MKATPAVLASALMVTVNTAVLAESEQRQLLLEEVIVTATKRESNLQDVAVAVTALGADLLQSAQINNADELTFVVPSLNMQRGDNPRSSSFAIRGIGTQSFSAAVEPSVSTMLDGVVMGQSGQAFMQLLDVERVEVLRGPQGTLFGKNSTGGVVHIITKNPSEEPTAELMGTAISEDEYRGGLTLSGPITDTVGYRLSAVGSTIEDFTDNAYDGGELNGSDDWSVRGKLRWFPAENVELKWASDYSDMSNNASAAPIRSLEPFGGNEEQVQAILDSIGPVQPGKKNEDVNINNNPFTNMDSWGHSLEANWDVGELLLTSISAYREFSVDGFVDVDSQPTNVLGLEQYGKSDQDQFTQELRLLSPGDAPLTYVAGLFYYEQTVKRNFRRNFEIIAGSPGQGVADFQVNTTNWAAFGEATWHFNEAWRLIVGARYTEDELDFSFERTLTGPQVGLPPPVAPTPGDTDENNLSPKVVVQWDYSDEGMTYLSYTEGYKGPAFDMAFGVDPVDLPRVDPETSKSWELGVKATLFDGRLRLNTAAFHSVYKDFQAQSFYDPDGIPPECPEDQPNCNVGDDPGGFLLINAGEVTTQGVEVDFLAQVTDKLRLTGGVAYVDAGIDDYPAGECSGGQVFRGENGCSRTNSLQDLSGGDLPFSPKWKGNLAASYTVPLEGSFDMVFKSMVRAQDEIQYSLSQDVNTIENGYAIYDASVVLQDHSDRWTATVFVKNIADKFYASSIQPNNPNILPNGYNHRYGKDAGRTYGIEMRYRWF
ncbi:MAG: TonB-dependent receptor [Pseudomonadales bacterium]|nr:TonB-dependent receptor [Pseudomonadales bacterium]